MQVFYLCERRPTNTVDYAHKNRKLFGMVKNLYQFGARPFEGEISHCNGFAFFGSLWYLDVTKRVVTSFRSSELFY